MGIMNKFIFTLIISILNIECADSDKKVINTCGRLEYKQPTNADECKEEGEMCCYVEITDPNDSSNNLKFCVSSPSDIKMEDVKDEVKEYTGYTLKSLKCNEGKFIINNLIIYSIIVIIMLF